MEQDTTGEALKRLPVDYIVHLIYSWTFSDTIWWNFVPIYLAYTPHTSHLTSALVHSLILWFPICSLAISFEHSHLTIILGHFFCRCTSIISSYVICFFPHWRGHSLMTNLLSIFNNTLLSYFRWYFYLQKGQTSLPLYYQASRQSWQNIWSHLLQAKGL